MENTPRVLIALITTPDNVRLQQAAVGGVREEGEGGGGRGGLTCVLHRELLMINAQQPRGPKAETCEL